jgi:hypothetical protein
MEFKEFVERYQDRNWSDNEMRNRWERMCEQLTPLEILQAIPLFPEAAGSASGGASSGSSSGGGGGYISGEGWAQWDQAPWSEVTFTWSEMV